MAVSPIRAGFHTITPYLIVPNVPRLIEFLTEAFGGELLLRKLRPDGQVMHAEMRIGNSMLMMAEATDQYVPMPTSIYLYVEDCDAVYQRALAAGGASVMEMRDMPYGERHSGVQDPSGNLWWVSTHIADPTPEEEALLWEKFQQS